MGHKANRPRSDGGRKCLCFLACGRRNHRRYHTPLRQKLAPKGIHDSITCCDKRPRLAGTSCHRLPVPNPPPSKEVRVSNSPYHPHRAVKEGQSHSSCALGDKIARRRQARAQAPSVMASGPRRRRLPRLRSDVSFGDVDPAYNRPKRLDNAPSVFPPCCSQ